MYPNNSIINGILYKLCSIRPELKIDKTSIIVGYETDLPISETKYLIYVLNVAEQNFEWVSEEAFKSGANDADILKKKLDLYYTLKKELFGSFKGY